MPRYTIFGAGAIGGLIGAALHRAGHDVTLVARGANRDALARAGLRLRTAEIEETVTIPVVGNALELSLRPGDTVFLGMKTQDCAAALDQLASIAPENISIVCATNGLESERMALRLFDNVYGMYVYVSSALVAPGEVSCYTGPGFGVLDIGRYPAGLDSTAETIAGHLRDAGFDSIVRPDIMRWKRGKLVTNMGNAIGAACSAMDQLGDIAAGAREEAELCLAAAQLDYASAAEVRDRAAAHIGQLVGGKPFPGSSTVQSLARGAEATEVDYLSGEVARLGRTFGVPTPVNAGLQRIIRDMTRKRAAPGTLSPAELRARLGITAPSGSVESHARSAPRSYRTPSRRR